MSKRWHLRGLVRKRLTCPECGFEQEIQRRRGRNHGAGHIKHLYCPGCQEVTGHVEQAEVYA